MVVLKLVDYPHQPRGGFEVGVKRAAKRMLNGSVYGIGIVSHNYKPYVFWLTFTLFIARNTRTFQRLPSALPTFTSLRPRHSYNALAL